MASITPSISDLMGLVRDPVAAPSSYNLVTGEVPAVKQGVALATATVFYLTNKPIVSGSIYLTYGSTVRQAASGYSGLTVDYANGLLTFSPAWNPTAPYFVDYNFNYFSSADYTSFLADGLRFLGIPAGSTIDEMLAPAAYESAKAFFYDARASQYADRYKSEAGGVGQDVDVVTKNFQDLSKKAQLKAVTLRDAFYTRFSASKGPSSHFFNYGVSKITPRG